MWNAWQIQTTGLALPLGGMDCKDGDNSIYPTAPELCDGIIND